MKKTGEQILQRHGRFAKYIFFFFFFFFNCGGGEHLGIVGQQHSGCSPGHWPSLHYRHIVLIFNDFNQNHLLGWTVKSNWHLYLVARVCFFKAGFTLHCWPVSPRVPDCQGWEKNPSSTQLRKVLRQINKSLCSMNLQFLTFDGM